MIKTKQGVYLNRLHPVMYLAMIVISKKYNTLGLDFVITSTYDSVHMEGSLHYEGCAIDVRTREITNSLELGELVDSIREDLLALDKCFDVVLESTHLHIEYDIGKKR